MTERDLFEYVSCEREIKRLHDEYLEEERRMSTPRTPANNGMPRGSGSDDPFLAILDRRTHLKDRLEKLAGDRLIAERRLDRAYAVLNTEIQRLVFIELYRKGKAAREACVALKYSMTHIYAQRKAILHAIEGLPA